MAFIVQAFIGTPSTTGTVLQMGREELVRPMAFGNNWNKLRVGILASVYMVPGSSGIFYANGFYLGVCQNGLGATCPSPIDAVYAAPFGASVTANAFPTYFSYAGQYYCYEKVGSTLTSGVIGSSQWYGAMYPYKAMFFVDFSFTANRQSLTWHGYNPGITGTTDASRSQFLTNMQCEDAAGLVGNTSDTGTSSIAYSGQFNLNCVCLAWNMCIPALMVSELCVTRWY